MSIPVSHCSKIFSKENMTPFVKYLSGKRRECLYLKSHLMLDRSVEEKAISGDSVIVLLWHIALICGYCAVLPSFGKMNIYCFFQTRYQGT